MTGLAASPRAAQDTYDVLVRGGTVVDGTGTPGRRADVAIRQGRIAAIGDLAAATAVTVVDAQGLVVAPGFIDVHTHADDLAAHPLAEHFARMGVTTRHRRQLRRLAGGRRRGVRGHPRRAARR